MSDTQTCPSRMQQPGPWKHETDLDEWLTDRWTVDHDQAEASRQEFIERNPGGSISHTANEWLWSWGPPRTCSFCGSIHADDAIRLIEEGWEVDPAKSYKRYLNPPGSFARHEAAISQLRAGQTDLVVPSVWSPVPPVKLYAWHMTDDQIGRFNSAIDKTA